MTVEAIVFIVIAILLVGVPAFLTFWDYKHYNPYTEVVCLNNNSFIVETRFISTLYRLENGEPSLLSGTSSILYEKFRNEVMQAAMKEKPRETKTYFLVNAVFRGNKIIIDYAPVDINSIYNR
jgi:hypothetical protein